MSKEWIELTENMVELGPDGGKILLDFELPNIARITLEQKSSPKDSKEFFAVTVGIYNKLINTSYFLNHEDALEHVNSTKILIQVFYGA